MIPDVPLTQLRNYPELQDLMFQDLYHTLNYRNRLTMIALVYSFVLSDKMHGHSTRDMNRTGELYLIVKTCWGRLISCQSLAPRPISQVYRCDL